MKQNDTKMLDERKEWEKKEEEEEEKTEKNCNQQHASIIYAKYTISITIGNFTQNCVYTFGVTSNVC